MSLNKDMVNKIERLVTDLLTDVYGDIKLVEVPIDFSILFTILGLELSIVEFVEPDISGALDRAKKTIYVSKADPVTRQAFTIAHELGHYILHENKQAELFYRKDAIKFGLDGITTSPAEKKDEEQQANWFAAALLMPSEIVRRKWYELNKDIEAIARFFGVSLTAATWRLVYLNLLPRTNL